MMKRLHLIVNKPTGRRSDSVARLFSILLLSFCHVLAIAQEANGSQDNPYLIDLTNPTAITNVMTMDEVTVGSNKYKRITLLAGGTSDDARVYYKLSGAANIADKVILWNYLENTDNPASTASNITLLVDGDAVSLYGMHLGGDVSLEAANGGEGKLTVSGSSTYFEKTVGGNGYALSFMEGYHFQVGTGLQVEVTSLLPRSDNKFQPFPDNVKGTFTINGALMGGTSFSTGAAPTNSTANANITIDQNATANAILQIDVPNGVQSSSLILKKKGADGTFTDYLTLPAKIAANQTRSISIYSICVPAGTYQCYDGEKVLEQFNNNSSKDRIKTSFEAKANAVTAYGLLCLPFDLSTITEATTFETWATNLSRAIYWGAATTASGVTNTRTVFSRLMQSGETVRYPVTFGSSGSTRYLLCSSNINIEVSGDVPALTFGADIIVKFIQGNDAAKPLEKPTITLTNTDKTKRALLVDGYFSSLHGSLIVNGSVELQGELGLYGSLKIDTPKETSNVTQKSTEKIRLYYVDDEERYVSLSDYRDADGNIKPSTITVSPGDKINDLTFSCITFKTTSNFNKVKVQPGLKFAIDFNTPGYQIILSKEYTDGTKEKDLLPLNGGDGTYSYQMTEKDATLKSLSIYGERLPSCLINGIPTPITLTCDENGIWKYTYTSSEGQTYSNLFNGTLALNKDIGKDAGEQPIEVKVEGDTERTLTLDAVALRPTSGEYAIKVSQGKLKISPNYNASTIIPPVKDGAYQPALLVADGASCQVMYTNSGNILFYGEAKAEGADVIKGLVQLQWANAIDKEVQITEKDKTKLSATFPALSDASPKPSIVAWNPNTYSTYWKTEYIVKKDGKQQVGKNSGGTEVTSYAYSSSAGNLTAFTELRDISADEMVGAANVGASGTDVTINASNKEYIVKSPIGLAWIAAVTNKKLTTGDAENPSKDGFAECTVRIGKLNWGETIDLSKLEFDWVPIGNSDGTPFKGTLNGAVYDYGYSTYKITNLPGSLIGKIDGAKILNMCVHLTGKEGEITGSSWGGLVATATNQTTIDNCYVSTTSAISPEQAPIVLGGSGLATVGGMVGTLDGTSTLKNCYSTLCLSVSTDNVTLGGIAGKSEGTLSNCFCLGSLSAPEGTVGGIVGDGSVEYGLALSPSITGATAYRVASATGKNNYASSKTLLNGVAVTSDVATSTHGATVYMHDFKTKLVGAWGDRQYDSQTGAFTNYPWTFDEYNNFTPWLGIKADDGTYASRSGYDQPYQFSDYLIYQLVTIDATVTYSEDLHKSRDLVIKPTGVLNCPSGASVHDVTIEPGGQITGGKDSYLYLNKFIIPREIGNQWTTFYSPASDLKASALSFALYRNTGYTDAKDASQVWTKDDVEAGSGITIKESSPYLLSAESAQTVTFTVDKPSITLNSALGTDGPAINTGIFLFKGNPRFQNVEMKNIYVLSADGSCFDLQATYTLKPFECYIVANAQTRSLVSSLSLKDMPTGIEQPLAATFRLWSSGGQLCLSAERDTEVTIVNVAGQVVYHQRIPAGEERITLPSGIYFVRGEGITYKVKL